MNRSLMDLQTVIASNIRRFRETCDLTQQDLAEIVDVKQGTVAGWESGRRDPGVEMLLRLSGVFGLYLHAFFIHPDSGQVEDATEHMAETFYVGAQDHDDAKKKARDRIEELFGNLGFFDDDDTPSAVVAKRALRPRRVLYVQAMSFNDPAQGVRDRVNSTPDVEPEVEHVVSTPDVNREYTNLMLVVEHRMECVEHRIMEAISPLVDELRILRDELKATSDEQPGHAKAPLPPVRRRSSPSARVRSGKPKQRSMTEAAQRASDADLAAGLGAQRAAEQEAAAQHEQKGRPRRPVSKTGRNAP